MKGVIITKESTGTRAIAAALCAILATSPLLGCVSGAQSSSSAKDQDAVKEGEEDIQEGKTIPYNKEGVYTATLKESDFV